MNALKQIPEGDSMKSDSERLAVLEAKAELYDKLLQQNSEALQRLSESVQHLVILEERHQALDRRHEQLRIEFVDSRNNLAGKFQLLENSMRALSEQTTVNSHVRGLWERLIIPAVSGIASGVAVSGVGYLIFRNVTGA